VKKLIPLAALLLLAACGKLSMENYNQLKVGMSYQEVTAIIGDANSCEEVIGTRSCVWGDEQKGIKAGFVADKAIAFSHKGLN
jgi:hypothetical protein